MFPSASRPVGRELTAVPTGSSLACTILGAARPRTSTWWPAKVRRASRPQYSTTGAWRPVSILDEWVEKEIRPISLRQLMVFGRSLTEARLISSANYVRTELPRRIAHRIRDMQRLPYAVVTNPHIRDVYDLYYHAFDTFRKVPEIRSLDDNDRFCQTVTSELQGHLTVIPKLALGVLECGGLVDADKLDKFMNTILRSRISRRVIAEQHLTLTETFNSPHFSPGARLSEADYIGQVFIKCVAKDIIQNVASTIRALARATYGPDVLLPEVKIDGNLDASFPYILSHLEYIIGELLRNSVRALIENQRRLGLHTSAPPPVEVTICASPQNVIIRICDRGGGVPREVLPFLWSFSKGPYSETLRQNLAKVPKMAATMQEVQYLHDELGRADLMTPKYQGSLDSLTSRPPNLQLGMSLPMSRVYAEYWAGSLELHSLEGYGVDAFLQISRLGNKNEQLTTRATPDGI